MRNYNIAGTDIEIATSTENYIWYKKEMRPLLNNVRTQSEKWYGHQGDYETASEKFPEIFSAVINPILDKGVEILAKQNVYSISREMLCDSFLKCDVLQGIFNLFDSMMEETDAITFGVEEASLRRQQRKASRSRVVAVGTDFKGMVKASVSAGTINAATGAMHSIGNAVGNAKTAFFSLAEIKDIYRKYKSKFSQEMCRIADKAVSFVRITVSEKTNLSFQFLMNDKVRNVGTSDAILANYRAGRIKDSEVKAQILDALLLNPLNIDIYRAIWDAYGDSNGDLRKMAKFFELSLDDYIQKSAGEHCRKILDQKCGEYLKAKNPLVESIAHEKEFTDALEEIRDFCREQQVEIDTIDAVHTIEEQLTKVDTEQRTVNGVLYDSREEAAAIRMDMETFSDFFTSHKIDEPDVYEKLCDVAFESELYQNHLKKIFEQEISYRDPVRLREHLQECVERYFPDEDKRKTIEIAGASENWEKKNGILENILTLEKTEAPVLLVNYKSNGKAGLLITNQKLHSYNKNLFSFVDQCFPIEEIRNLEYMGQNILRVHLREEPTDLIIKKPLDFSERNILCQLLAEVIRRIMNLRQEDRGNLKYINENSVRCSCGAYIPNTTRICPSCFRMRMDGNVFVETVCCKSCGQRIRIDAKFCNHCGKKAGADPEPALKCPGCGSIVKSGQKFCKRCGTKL
ncbi:MAG: zinc ribbon domain-containing protein [Clostridiales bacterium]|nr:zinc ribbon domain-containing protein [Clostridiales bacterium]